MLVHHPHNLGRVHRGAAAERDDAVRLKGGHRLAPSFAQEEGRVGRDVGEGGVADAHFIQLVGDALRVAVVVEEAVGDDEGLLLAHDRSSARQRDRQAALLEIDLRRGSEPEHVSLLSATVLILSRCLTPTFSETELPPHEPQPSVSDGAILKLYRSPMPPCEHGVLTTMRQASIALGGSMISPSAPDGCTATRYGRGRRPQTSFRPCRAPRQSFGVVHRQHRESFSCANSSRMLDRLDLADEDFGLLPAPPRPPARRWCAPSGRRSSR